MALFDIDKNSDDRGSPMPNSHDQLAHDAVMAKATNSVNYTVQQPFAALGAGKNGQFTIVASGIIPSTPTTSATTTITVAHGLSFVPAIMAFAFTGSLYSPLPYLNIDVPDGMLISEITSITVDATNITLTFRYNTAVGTIGNTRQVRYFLLQQTSN